MQCPHWTRRQLKDVEGVDDVGHIAQHDIAWAVGTQVLCRGGFDEHWQRPECEQHGRERTGDDRQVEVHAGLRSSLVYSIGTLGASERKRVGRTAQSRTERLWAVVCMPGFPTDLAAGRYSAATAGICRR